MKTTIKLFTLLMVLLLIVPCFAACGNNNNNKPGDETTAGGGEETTAGGGEEQTTTEGSQYKNMGGYQYKPYAWMDAHDAGDSGMNGGFYPIDFYVEALGDSKDPVTVATWTRNTEIESDYNCYILPVKATTSHTTELTNLYTGGQVKLDLAIILDRCAAQCATMNLLTNLTDKKNIHLEEAYFDQNSVNQLSMGGKLYYLSGDMNVSTLDNACVTLVNEKLYASALPGEAPIYELIKTGKWTMAKMMEMANKVNVDVGEDGVFSADGGDIWGYLPYGTSGIYHFYACGGRITLNDEDGYPAMVIDGDTTEKAINTLMETINPNFGLLAKGISGVGGGNRNNWFSAEKVLFTDTIMWDIRRAIYSKVTTWKYGILPMALVDESQFNAEDTDTYGYLTAVQYGYNGTTALWAIPSFYNDEDNATILFNAFAERSSLPGSTMEAFYTKTISLQAAKDENSRQMVDVIRKSMTYDIAGCYDEDWGGFQSLVRGVLTATANPLNSITPAKVQQAKMKMEQTLELFKNPTSPEA